jgi:hypothetical protein
MSPLAPLLALLPVLVQAADAPSVVYLQALTPTSGTGAESVLAEDGQGWQPAGDPRDEGILFRFEQPTAVDAIRLRSCGGRPMSLAISVDGAQIACADPGVAAVTVALPDGERGVRSVYLRIERAGGCLARVEFLRRGERLPVRPPRRVPGKVIATSTLAPIDAYHPSYLFDGRLDFGWVEGAKGPGVGECVEIELERPVEVTAVELWNGYQRSADHFRKNARARKVSVGADRKVLKSFPVKDAMGAQKLVLPAPVASSRWCLRIDEAFPGTHYQDLVISELRFWDAAGPFTVAAPDAAQREVALRAEIAGGPLPALLDRSWVSVCKWQSDHRLKLRGNHTFAWFEMTEQGDGTVISEVFDGVWVPVQAGGPWAEARLYGRRHRIERDWRPYEMEARQRETDQIAGGTVELARVADLGPAGWRELHAEWRESSFAAGPVTCIPDADAAYERLVKRRAVVVRGAPFQSLLAEPE